jgi:hypothetical protein
MKGARMGKMIGWVGLLAGVLLTGCGGGVAAPAGKPGAAVVNSLRSQAQQLPGVELAAGEPLRLQYPHLFEAGAALPLAGGVEQLVPLGNFLQQLSGSRWQLRLRGDGEQGLALAEARARLLRGYFERRGLAGERLQWLSEAGPGAALELQLAPVP